MKPIIQKHDHYRNPKLLSLANGAPCMNCGAEDGTVVACHSNDNAHGKGIGIKADDACIAFLCVACHDWYDGRAGTGEGWSNSDPTGNFSGYADGKAFMFLEALANTYLWLLKSGKLKVS